MIVVLSTERFLPRSLFGCQVFSMKIAMALITSACDTSSFVGFWDERSILSRNSIDSPALSTMILLRNEPLYRPLSLFLSGFLSAPSMRRSSERQSDTRPLIVCRMISTLSLTLIASVCACICRSSHCSRFHFLLDSCFHFSVIGSSSVPGFLPCCLSLFVRP